MNLAAHANSTYLRALELHARLLQANTYNTRSNSATDQSHCKTEPNRQTNTNTGASKSSSTRSVHLHYEPHRAFANATLQLRGAGSGGRRQPHLQAARKMEEEECRLQRTRQVNERQEAVYRSAAGFGGLWTVVQRFGGQIEIFVRETQLHCFRHRV
jgi:hypothetical protein